MIIFLYSEKLLAPTVNTFFNLKPTLTMKLSLPTYLSWTCESDIRIKSQHYLEEEKRGGNQIFHRKYITRLAMYSNQIQNPFYPYKLNKTKASSSKKILLTSPKWSSVGISSYWNVLDLSIFVRKALLKL